MSPSTVEYILEKTGTLGLRICLEVEHSHAEGDEQVKFTPWGMAEQLRVEVAEVRKAVRSLVWWQILTRHKGGRWPQVVLTQYSD
mgnify:CR=1 FL=1